MLLLTGATIAWVLLLTVCVACGECCLRILLCTDAFSALPAATRCFSTVYNVVLWEATKPVKSDVLERPFRSW